jgi:amino acid permease
MNKYVISAFLFLIHPALVTADYLIVDEFFTLALLYIPPFFALPVIIFCWGLFKYVTSTNNEDQQKRRGKKVMIWCLATLLILIALWVIIGYLQDTMGLEGSVGFTLPPGAPPIPK